MLRCDMYGIYICVCDINDVYTIYEVLSNFKVSLATQKTMYAHLEGKKKWGQAFLPSNQTMAPTLAILAAVLAPSQQL